MGGGQGLPQYNPLHCTALYNTIQHSAESKCRVCTVQYTAQHCTALYCTVLKQVDRQHNKSCRTTRHSSLVFGISIEYVDGGVGRPPQKLWWNIPKLGWSIPKFVGTFTNKGEVSLSL